MQHVFISYVRENSAAVDSLAAALRSSGISVWLDRDQIDPGKDWRVAITSAIRDGAYFIACFSPEYERRHRSFMYEELNVAIEQLRMRSPFESWLIPLRLAECKIPALPISPGRDLTHLQRIDYFPEPRKAIDRIVALVRASAGPDAGHTDTPESLFDVRRRYFKAEKVFLANQFAPLLFHRAKHLIESNKNPIAFFLDSGTTIYPLFEALAKCGLEARHRGEAWIQEDKLTIITNSIPGILWFVESASLNPDSLDSSSIIPIEQLPGVPQANYWAATGPRTTQALSELATDGRTVITITTGNFIRIVPGTVPYPVPLVRGNLHGPIKEAALRICDEAYVLAPLGKVIANATPKEINLALHEEARGEYAELSLDGVRVRPRLVSTRRPRGELLAGLGEYLVETLRAPRSIDADRFVTAKLAETDHLLFEYKHEDRSPDHDFPDPRTRTPDFQRWFTDV